MMLAIIVLIIIIIFLFTPDSFDNTFDGTGFDNSNSDSSHSESHADWVKKDAEHHRHISEQYDRDWAEDYMDDHDI